MFQAYGVVTDVFIAYKSRRRLTEGSTFAFVRFSSKHEAITAVRRADGRILDGFKIRVFNDNIGVSKNKRAEIVEGRAVEVVDNTQHATNLASGNVIHVTFEDEIDSWPNPNNDEKGYDVKVSIWHELLVVIQFENVKDHLEC
ncbi:serine/arginine-rich splicing factor SC35-like [Hibiscus syriacus]|uniref:serine/arginine-rich splicing factor SC35-like n=1 Tax=Hibiscus syriacus TaxID=106335 RepID=UPI00192238DE|nr:serine/arginine-rich splicing factor SC35-like [Hibiscus syriacus]